MLVSFSSHFSEISIYLGRRPTLAQQLGYTFLSNEEQGLEFKGDLYWYITYTNKRLSIVYFSTEKQLKCTKSFRYPRPKEVSDSFQFFSGLFVKLVSTDAIYVQPKGHCDHFWFLCFKGHLLEVNELKSFHRSLTVHCHFALNDNIIFKSLMVPTQTTDFLTPVNTIVIKKQNKIA